MTGQVGLHVHRFNIRKAIDSYRYKPCSPITVCTRIMDGILYICHLFCLISQLVQTLNVKKKKVTYCNLKSLTNSQKVVNKFQPNSISQILFTHLICVQHRVAFREITAVLRQNFSPGYLYYVLDSRQKSMSLMS